MAEADDRQHKVLFLDLHVSRVVIQTAANAMVYESMMGQKKNGNPAYEEQVNKTFYFTRKNKLLYQKAHQTAQRAVLCPAISSIWKAVRSKDFPVSGLGQPFCEHPNVYLPENALVR